MLELDKENFAAEVLEAQGPGSGGISGAPKCEPCKALLPGLEELVGRYPAVKFAKLNILENRRLAIGQRGHGAAHHPDLPGWRESSRAEPGFSD